MVSLYDTTVPLFTRGLKNLKEYLKKGEKWCDDNGHDHSKLLQAKLADDMKDLIFQIRIVSDTSKGILGRIGGEEATSMEDNEKTFADLYQRIDKTVALLEKAKADKFVEQDAKVNLKLGPMDVTFSALDYLNRFAIPNFFFHQVTAYDIMRQAGVPLGKGDFLGASDLTS